MRETVNLKHKKVTIILGDESVIDMSFDEFRHYAINNLKDSTLVPALLACEELGLAKRYVQRGSVTYFLDLEEQWNENS